MARETLVDDFLDVLCDELTKSLPSNLHVVRANNVHAWIWITIDHPSHLTRPILCKLNLLRNTLLLIKNGEDICGDDFFFGSNSIQVRLPLADPSKFNVENIVTYIKKWASK